MSILQLKGITLGFGGPPVLDRVDLTVHAGERLALLGRNGAGKSTLLDVIQGKAEPDDGTLVREPGLRVGYLSQRVPDDLAGTVLSVVLAGCGGAEGADEATQARAEAVISRVGLEPSARSEDLSAGLKRRVLLAQALANEPDLLLLDEPTNHLDIDSITWLEDFLRRHVRTFLFVTHDRAFLRRLATSVLDLDRGTLTRHDTDYDTFAERKAHSLDVEARTGREFDKRLKQEESWIRQGVRERRKRNQGRVRRLKDMRDTHSGRRDVAGSVQMQVSSAAPSGRIVVEAKDVSFAWKDGPSIHGLDAMIQRGDRVGIIGPNGSGKTTLLRLLLGELEPSGGSIRRGANLEIGYFDQLHATLDETVSAAENVGGGNQTVFVGGKERHVVSYLRDFLFTSDQARGGVTHFSGGERNRLLLARLFCRPSNVLVLDEPTNDLDVETLEVLETLLTSYDGTVLVVSHDRELLDQVATSTLVLEGDDSDALNGEGAGRVGQYAGGYSDWLAQRREAGSAKAGSSKAGFSKAGSSKAGSAQAGEKRKGKRKRKGPAPSKLDKEEKLELRNLPGRIEALEAEQVALHEQMADPAFFRGPGAAIATAKARLAAAGQEVEAAYARWEALEAKREAPAGP